MPRRLPLSVEEAKEAARRIAEKHDRFDCTTCAKEIARRLGPAAGMTFERVQTSDNSDVIGLPERGMQISTNRAHVGVRIGDSVFDNHHPEGVAAAEWLKRFVAATGAPLTHESRPLHDFFGAVFLTKKFTRWVFRW